MNFVVKSGVARPGPKMTGGASRKYPLEQMKVGDYFVVSQELKEEDQTPKRFRDRINQAVRTYKQRVNQRAHLEPGYEAETHKDVEFSVLTLGEPPEESPDAWTAGDVGVWRDA